MLVLARLPEESIVLVAEKPIGKIKVIGWRGERIMLGFEGFSNAIEIVREELLADWMSKKKAS
jgi:sRNA-binding carbon storage regulator CsrA